METNLNIGERVELLPGREEVYNKVYPASPGVVSGLRTDRYGYPQIYIIWDKDHWRYNGEDDLWTFASHFRPIEDEERELGPEVHEVPSSLPEEEDRIPSSDQIRSMEYYMDALMTAADRASESDAFFFICLKQNDKGQNGLEMLHAIADERYRNISIADVFALAEREMRRRGM
jgi:hypothetical protein